MSVYQTYVNAMNEKIKKQISISNPFVFKHISNLKVSERYTGSYMSANVLFNLLNELRKRLKIRGFAEHFCNCKSVYNKFLVFKTSGCTKRSLKKALNLNSLGCIDYEVTLFNPLLHNNAF